MLKPRMRGGKSFDRENTQEEDDMSKKVNYDSRNNQRYDDEDSNYEDSQESEDDEPSPNTEKFEETSGLKGNQRFKNFNEVFQNLTKQKIVNTKYNIVSCCISYNSKSAIAVLKASDRKYYVAAYSLETYEKSFEEKIGGLPNSYIKVKEIE